MERGVVTFSELQKTSLSEDPDAFMVFAENIDHYSLESFLQILFRNLDSQEALKSVLYKLGHRVMKLEAEHPGMLSKHLQHFLRLIDAVTGAAPLLFSFLTVLNRKKDEEARNAVLESISRSDFTLEPFMDLLGKEGGGTVVHQVLTACPSQIESFIRAVRNIDEPTAVKNIAQVLPLLPPSYFSNFHFFEFLLESDNYVLRCCFLEILEGLVLHFKSKRNIEAIEEALSLLNSYLCDMNYLVRNRVLGILSNLFAKEAILKDSRNVIIASIIGRTLDKTVIVRKRAVSIMTQLLLNHPFRHKADLRREEKENRRLENDDNLQKKELTPKERLEADFEEFCFLMESALETITRLLDCTLKTDMKEILEFIKHAYILRVAHSHSSASKLLTMVYSNERDSIVAVFNEIISARPADVYTFASNRSFLFILPRLKIDLMKLYNNFMSNTEIHKSMLLLTNSHFKPSEEECMELLGRTTELLFSSRSASEVKERTRIYRGMLQVAQRVQGRLPYNHELFKTVSKSLAKMIFFEPNLIKHAVELFYSSSQNPERNSGMLLHHISLSKDKVKILEAVGWIALHQFYLLERLERRLSSLHLKRDEMENIRRSIDRASLTSIRERRRSVEDSRRSFGSGISGLRLSIRLDSLREAMKDKDESEIGDFFFYLKEDEMLTSPDALLSQFVPLVLSSINSDDELTQSVAYRALSRMMIASSLFFRTHYQTTFLPALENRSPRIRSNALVALHDFTVFYNSAVDPGLLFAALDDSDIRKNALLVIFSLLQKNVIRVRNFSVRITQFLFDEELGTIVVEMMRTFSSNNNVMSLIFYETFLSDLGSEYTSLLAKYVDSSIQDSLFLKCMKNTMGQTAEGERKEKLKEKLREVSKVFSLSEKFLQTYSSHPELISVLGSGGEKND